MSANSDKTLDALNAVRGSFEWWSDQWSNLLIFATAIVFIGVIVESVADVIEVRADIRKGHGIELHHVFMFVGSFLVGLFVAIEGIAEWKISGDETALRNTNASVQTELRKKADDANARALKIAKAEGGLDALVKPKLKEIEQDTKDLKNVTKNANDALGQVSDLNRAEKVLRGNLASDSAA